MRLHTYHLCTPTLRNKMETKTAYITHFPFDYCCENDELYKINVYYCSKKRQNTKRFRILVLRYIPVMKIKTENENGLSETTF